MSRFLQKYQIIVLIVIFGMTGTTGVAQKCKLGKGKTLGEDKSEFPEKPEFVPRENDDVWLLSTRQVRPTHFQPGKLTIKRRVGNQWQCSDINSLLATHCGDEKPCILYVHGNRQNLQWAEYRGLQTYCNMTSGSQCQSIRFIIWAWPSEDDDKPIKNYLPTLKRANDEGFAIGWFLKHAGGSNRVSLFGYSLGAQSIVSALEVLRCEFKICEQYRVGFLAPVVACRWGKCRRQLRRVYGQVDSALIVQSSQDYAIKAYKAGCTLYRRWGYTGVEKLELVDRCNKIHELDVVNATGKKHGIHEYFACQKVAREMTSFLTGDCGCKLGQPTCECRGEQSSSQPDASTGVRERRIQFNR